LPLSTTDPFPSPPLAPLLPLPSRRDGWL
jgi:hypothetical protein